MSEENEYPQTKEWLIAELTRRELDVDAYGEYLMSFLVPETPSEEIIPEVVDVLGGLIPEDAAKEFSESLVKEWKKELNKIQNVQNDSKEEESKNSEEKANDLENAILKVIEEEDEKIALQAIKEKEEGKDEKGDSAAKEEKRELTPEEKAMKARVLAQYGGIEVDIDLSDGKSEKKEFVNPNVAAVAAEKQKYRDQQKAAHDAKQQEIKKSQENQKKTREEKKAKRRAACQKGERRR